MSTLVFSLGGTDQVCLRCTC